MFHLLTNTFMTWHSLTINPWRIFSVLKSRKVLNVITCLFKGFLQRIWKPSEEWKTFLYTGERPSPWSWWQDAWQQMCPVCWSFVSIDVVSLEWFRQWSGDWLEWWVRTVRICCWECGGSFMLSTKHNTTY